MSEFLEIESTLESINSELQAQLSAVEEMNIDLKIWEAERKAFLKGLWIGIGYTLFMWLIFIWLTLGG